MSRKPSDKASPASADELGYIAEQLRPLAVPIEDLLRDPANARKHSRKNLEAIAASMARFGQRQPLVAHRQTRIIQAGNGRHEAAERLGWTHLAVVWVDDDPTSALGYAIADNRTAELAEWDDAILEDLLARVEADTPDLYDDLLLAELRAEDQGEDEPKQEKQGPPTSTYQIIIECDDAKHRDKVLRKLRRDGLKCRAVTWT